MSDQISEDTALEQDLSQHLLSFLKFKAVFYDWNLLMSMTLGTKQSM
jgi:hypothetical protein